MSERGPDAVIAGIASPDYDHIPILGREPRLVDVVAHLLLLPRLQELHGEVDAVQLPAGDGQVSRPGGARAQHCGVILSQEFLNREALVRYVLGIIVGKSGSGHGVRFV